MCVIETTGEIKFLCSHEFNHAKYVSEKKKQLYLVIVDWQQQWHLSCSCVDFYSIMLMTYRSSLNCICIQIPKWVYAKVELGKSSMHCLSGKVIYFYGCLTIVYMMWYNGDSLLPKFWLILKYVIKPRKNTNQIFHQCPPSGRTNFF